MFEYFLKYLQENYQNFEVIEPQEKGILLLKDVSTDLLLYHVLDVNEEDEVAVLLSVYTFNIPEEKRNAMCILINQLNYDLQEGNFEMDFEDGELRFRNHLMYYKTSTNPVGVLFDRLLQRNLETARSAVSGFARLVEENISPFEVYHSIQRA